MLMDIKQFIASVLSKINAEAWKSKAKERSLEIRSLKKKNKEVALSRDYWKSKYMTEIKKKPVSQ
jgi:hypothetical protein